MLEFTDCMYLRLMTYNLSLLSLIFLASHLALNHFKMLVSSDLKSKDTVIDKSSQSSDSSILFDTFLASFLAFRPLKALLHPFTHIHGIRCHAKMPTAHLPEQMGDVSYSRSRLEEEGIEPPIVWLVDDPGHIQNSQSYCGSPALQVYSLKTTVQ